MTTDLPVPDEARQLVAECLAHEAAFWDGLRAFNRAEHATGADVDVMLSDSDAHFDIAEQIRRRWFPRAGRLIVTADFVLTVSPTGRSIRRAWAVDKSLLPVK